MDSNANSSFGGLREGVSEELRFVLRMRFDANHESVHSRLHIGHDFDTSKSISNRQPCRRDFCSSCVKGWANLVSNFNSLTIWKLEPFWDALFIEEESSNCLDIPVNLKGGHHVKLVVFRVLVHLDVVLDQGFRLVLFPALDFVEHVVEIVE